MIRRRSTFKLRKPLRYPLYNYEHWEAEINRFAKRWGKGAVETVAKMREELKNARDTNTPPIPPPYRR